MKQVISGAVFLLVSGSAVGQTTDANGVFNPNGIFAGGPKGSYIVPGANANEAPSISATEVNTINLRVGDINSTPVTGITTSTNNGVNDRLTSQGYVDQQVGAANGRIDATNTNVANNTTAIKNIQTTVENEVIRLDKRIDNIVPGSVVNSRLSGIDNRITQVERAANRGVAGVAALSQVQITPGRDFAVGAGIANYRGETELAIGAAARINHRLQVRGGYSTSGVSAAGITYSW